MEPRAVDTSRPSNFIRNAYHVGNAVVVVLLVEYVLTAPWARLLVAGTGFCAAWSMEISRMISPTINNLLMRLFAPVAHPDEANHINSATWYTTAILLLALFAPLHAGVAGLAVLGLGDPAAAIVGRRWGRHRFADGRSLEGTVTFLAAGALAAWIPLAVWHTDLAGKGTLALAAAIGGALSEIGAARALRLFGISRVDDNLVIPIAATTSLMIAHLVMVS